MTVRLDEAYNNACLEEFGGWHDGMQETADRFETVFDRMIDDLLSQGVARWTGIDRTCVTSLKQENQRGYIVALELRAE